MRVTLADRHRRTPAAPTSSASSFLQPGTTAQARVPRPGPPVGPPRPARTSARTPARRDVDPTNPSRDAGLDDARQRRPVRHGDRRRRPARASPSPSTRCVPQPGARPDRRPQGAIDLPAGRARGRRRHAADRQLQHGEPVRRRDDRRRPHVHPGRGRRQDDAAGQRASSMLHQPDVVAVEEVAVRGRAAGGRDQARQLHGDLAAVDRRAPHRRRLPGQERRDRHRRRASSVATRRRPSPAARTTSTGTKLFERPPLEISVKKGDVAASR